MLLCVTLCPLIKCPKTVKILALKGLNKPKQTIDKCQNENKIWLSVGDQKLYDSTYLMLIGLIGLNKITSGLTSVLKASTISALFFAFTLKNKI